MLLNGQQIIGGRSVAEGSATFFGRNPATGEPTTPTVHEATLAEVDEALRTADRAFEAYRVVSGDRIAAQSNAACRTGVPTTSIRFRSLVPRPASSARRRVLSQLSKGAVPRSAIGS